MTVLIHWWFETNISRCWERRRTCWTATNAHEFPISQRCFPILGFHVSFPPRMFYYKIVVIVFTCGLLESYLLCISTQTEDMNEKVMKMSSQLLQDQSYWACQIHQSSNNQCTDLSPRWCHNQLGKPHLHDLKYNDKNYLGYHFINLAWNWSEPWLHVLPPEHNVHGCGLRLIGSFAITILVLAEQWFFLESFVKLVK